MTVIKYHDVGLEKQKLKQTNETTTTKSYLFLISSWNRAEQTKYKFLTLGHSIIFFKFRYTS